MTYMPYPEKSTDHDSVEPASKPNPSEAGFLHGRASTISATAADAGEK
jgi:hypothetical protein